MNKQINKSFLPSIPNGKAPRIATRIVVVAPFEGEDTFVYDFKNQPSTLEGTRFGGAYETITILKDGTVRLPVTPSPNVVACYLSPV
jgi:hypothetical protein